MRKLILAAAVAATAVPFVAAPAEAQGRREIQERRECARELRNADSNREYRRESRECRREISQARREDWRRYNRYDWNRWSAAVKLPSDGYFEVWARATGSNGRMQPPVPANWNPQGYGGNAIHRVAILVG